jgi:hypothetical protein
VLCIRENTISAQANTGASAKTDAQMQQKQIKVPVSPGQQAARDNQTKEPGDANALTNHSFGSDASERSINRPKLEILAPEIPASLTVLRTLELEALHASSAAQPGTSELISPQAWHDVTLSSESGVVDVTVFLNPDDALFADCTGDDQAQEFVRLVFDWDRDNVYVPERRLSKQDQEEFFNKFNQVSVIGISEFKYTDGGKKQVPELEREVWFRVPNEPDYVILHIHYDAPWVKSVNSRDRTAIKQANLRHSVPKKTRNSEVFHIKCKDLDVWREKYGTMVTIPGISDVPHRVWRWQQEPHRHPRLVTLLQMADNSTRRNIRSIDIPVDPCDGKSSDVTGVALIFCVDRYRSLPVLKNASVDAVKLENCLVNLGWEVDKWPEVTVAEAKEAFNAFSSRTSHTNKYCLFAFIGHGFQMAGDLHFLFKDSNIQDLKDKPLEEVCMSYSHIMRSLSQVRAKGQYQPTVLVFDCCRSEVDWALHLGEASRNLVKDITSEYLDKQKEQKKMEGKQDEFPNYISIFSTTKGEAAKDTQKSDTGGLFMSKFCKLVEAKQYNLNRVLQLVNPQMEGLQLCAAHMCNNEDFYMHKRSAESKRFVNDETEKFWEQNFDTRGKVPWDEFKLALERFLRLELHDLTAVKTIKENLMDKDKNIRANHLNTYTRQKGLRAYVLSLLTRSEPVSPATPQTPGIHIRRYVSEICEKPSTPHTQPGSPDPRTGINAGMGKLSVHVPYGVPTQPQGSGVPASPESSSGGQEQLLKSLLAEDQVC